MKAVSTFHRLHYWISPVTVKEAGMTVRTFHG